MSAPGMEGPWVVEPINNGATYQVTTTGADFSVVCETPCGTDLDRDRAHLIASAPDLLDAVKDAAKLVDDISKLLSDRTYRAEELKDPEAWKDADEWMRDGTLASYRDQFTKALSSASPTIEGVGK